MLSQLAELGLDDREARFYLAVLTLGQTTVAKAAIQAKVTRTSGYDLARRLVQRGFLQTVSFGEEGRREDRTRTALVAADPANLYGDIEQRRTVLDALVPQLRAMQSSSRGRPRVRYLEGPTGIRAALFETLDWPSPLRGIFAMKDLFRVPGEHALGEYVQGRRDRQLQLQVVRSVERDVPQRWPTSTEDYRETRYAPPAYVFTMTTIIGCDSVAVISSWKEKFAMMLDSPEYARTQSHLFDVLWQVSTSTAAPQQW